VRSEADTPQAFLSFLEKPLFLLQEENSEPHPIEVENAWLHKGFVILKIKGTEDRKTAESLRDGVIVIRRKDRPPLPANQFYWDQLIGLEVRDPVDDRKIGKVKDVLDIAGNVTLEVEKKEGKTFLLPFVQAFVRSVDPDQGMLYASLPEGLDEL